jgi:chlorophyll/bacteriochlorophyll a synthase
VVMCGAAASGNYHWIWNPFDPADRDVMMGLQDASKGLLAVVLAGPFSEGFAQTINDWYDREIDAINEPYRPIPSGAIAPREVFEQLRFLFLGGLGLALGLDYVNHQQIHAVTAITLLGYFMSYIYSAPPLKLKQNGWTGDLAIGLCYISFPWWCGHAVFGGTFDQPMDYILPLAYSLTGIGAGIVNDFKSMEGDRTFGLQSIPVQVGVENAAILASAIPDLVQFGIAAYLFSLGETMTAAFILAMVLPQLYLQSTLLLKDPVANDIKYMALSQPFLFLGLLATAFCMGQ